MANEIVEEVTHLFSGEENLSFTERAISVAVGLALAATAAQPRPNKILSLAALVVGSALAIRGATGHCAVKSMIGHDGPADRLA